MADMSPESLLPLEKYDTRSHYFPPPKTDFFSLYEIAEAFLRPAGRFRSPLSFFERIQLKLVAASRPLDFFSLSKNFFYNHPKLLIPYEWQVLLRYLQNEKIINFSYSPLKMLSYDATKVFSCVLYPYGYGQKADESPTFTSWGNSPSFEEALSRSVGEMLERYFLWRPTKKLKHSSYDTVKARVPVFFAKRIQSNPFIRKQEEISWVQAREIISRKEVCVPAYEIFWGLPEAERKDVYPTSNGAAGHFTFEEAVLSGLYERIERDGFLIHWLNKLSPPKIRKSTLQDQSLVHLIASLTQNLFEVEFLDVTTDLLVPSFICVLIDRSEKGPRVSIGGGSGWKIEKTLYDILIKTLASYRNIQSFREDAFELIPGYIPFSDGSIGLKERLLLWNNPTMFPEFSFFLAGNEVSLEDILAREKVFSSPKEELHFMKSHFQKKGSGYEIYVYEEKNKVLDTLGYQVVRVIVPEIVPLYLREDKAEFSFRRLREVPHQLGFTSTPTEWNPLPHPFP